MVYFLEFVRFKKEKIFGQYENSKLMNYTLKNIQHQNTDQIHSFDRHRIFSMPFQ